MRYLSRQIKSLLTGPRGTLRFIVLRSTRFELFISRFLGQNLILAILVFATLVASSAMALYRDSALATDILPLFGFVLFHMIFVLLPVVAVTALTSVMCQSARSATFLAIIGISLPYMMVGIASYYLPQLNFLGDYLLGAQLMELASSSGLSSATHLILPAAQSLVLLAIGLWLFRRSAL